MDKEFVKEWVYAVYTRPEVTFQLTKNGKHFLEPIILKDGQTVANFTGLALQDLDGKDYVYSVEEIDVHPDYDVSYRDNIVTNTYNKDTVLVDPDTDIEVVVPPGAFECEVILHVDPVDRETPNKFTDAYDIYFTCKGSKVRVVPVKELRVTIPFVTVDNNNLEVFHEEADMSRTPVEFTSNSTSATFMATDFSVYILTSDKPAEKPTLPNTGEKTMNRFVPFGFLLAGAFLSLKKKREED